MEYSPSPRSNDFPCEGPARLINRGLTIVFLSRMFDMFHKQNARLAYNAAYEEELVA